MMTSLAVESMTPEQMAAELKSLRKALANIEDNTRVKELKHEVELLQDENAQLKKAFEQTRQEMFVRAKELARRRKVYLSSKDIAPFFVINANQSKFGSYEIMLEVQGDRLYADGAVALVRMSSREVTA